MEAMTVPADKSVEGRIRKLARIAMVAVLVGGLFAIAYLHANGVASCLNNQLAHRNTPAALDAEAHITYARVQQRYDTAFSDLTTALARKEPASKIGPLFVKVTQLASDKKVASIAYTDTLAADQALRDAHPLGSC
jgi:hypothetical protein